MKHKSSIKDYKATFKEPKLAEPHWVILRLIFDNIENQTTDWYKALKMLKDIYGNRTISNATLLLLCEKYGAEHL